MISEKELEISLHFSSINAKIKALKDALSEEQILVYNKSIDNSKKKILELHPNISESLSELVNKLYK